MAVRRWIREDYLGNRAIKRDRVFRDRNNPLDYMSEEDLLFNYRFSRGGIMFLTDILTESLGRTTERSHAIPVYLQVMTALYYLASSSFQRCIANCRDLGVSRATVCRIIHDFCNCLCRKVNQFIQFPQRRAVIIKQHQQFYSDHKIPSVLGLIDGTQIEILAPTEHEDVYVNRSNYHSINTQTVCDYECKIINIVARWPGSVHDSTILNESSVLRQMQQPQDGVRFGLLLGDSGYQCTSCLITPYRQTIHRHQELFNSAHKSCRSKVERTIGQLKRRWPCIGRRLSFSPDKACKVIVSCAILYNLAKRFGLPDVDGDAQVQNNAATMVMYDGNEDTAMRDLIARQM